MQDASEDIDRRGTPMKKWYLHRTTVNIGVTKKWLLQRGLMSWKNTLDNDNYVTANCDGISYGVVDPGSGKNM